MEIVKKLVLLVSLLRAFAGFASDSIELSDNAQLSVLTCSAGPDLYSAFGHTAIRLQDSINGQWIDVVYNYGTFRFSDDFYFLFAQGKLDYLLSRSSFGDFQLEYLQTGRGIWEQRLLLSKQQKQRLFDLLEENYLKENRTYRYDFFYDNCSTRVRDIIKKAIDNKCAFTYVYPESYTYRDAIQHYLDYNAWSDLGIDIALGLPCDKTMEQEGAMFLPDSLMNELNFATLGNGALAAPVEEVIPQEYEPQKEILFTPLNVFGALFLVFLLAGWLLRKKMRVHFFDRLFLFVIGMVGLLVVFLWFFTDHTATIYNWNILWANPFLIVVSFLPLRFWGNKIRLFWKVYAAALLIVLLTWPFFPQRMHVAVIPIVGTLLWTAIRYLRPMVQSTAH
jgi:hypothetical protein